MKNFIMGFIGGGIICATVTGLAVEYAVTVNPFPVKVNGAEAAIEGYNINDNTYFKLRDVADAVGGFRVDFVNNEIMITTVESTPTPTEMPDLIPAKDLLELSEGETIDGLPAMLYNGKYYVYQQDIEDRYKGDYTFSLDNGTYKISWKKVFFDDYPQGGEYNLGVELNWYNTVLQPWLANEGWKR